MAMKEVLKERLDSSLDGEELTEALVLIRTRAADLESVRKLNCWACNIGDVNIVRRMPNLEVCSLTINKLTSLRDFSHCHNLQELYVRTNNIQHLSDIYYLKHLKKLRSLWLSENPCASRDNYRPTVLKVLPNLHKLDNIAVTGEEVARAQTEGDDLPIPVDFTFSGVFSETAFSSEDSTDDKREKSASVSSEKSASVSSEKWARSRQKRQQKKREEYLREKRGAGNDGDGVKSGGDGSAQSGEDGGGYGMRSSSDSADSDDLFCSKGSSKHEVVEQEYEKEGVGNIKKIDDDNVDISEAKKDSPSTIAKWALNIEVLESKILGTQDNLELEVEILDTVKDSDIDVDKSDTGRKVVETNEEEQNTCSSSEEDKICQNDSEVQDISVEKSSVETGSSKVSKLLNSSVFLEANPEVSNSTESSKSLNLSDKDLTLKLTSESSKSLLVSDKNPAVKLTSIFSIDVAKMIPVDSNTNAHIDIDAQTDEIVPLILEDRLGEDLKTELPDLAVEAAGNETISCFPEVQSVFDSRLSVSLEKYKAVGLGKELETKLPDLAVEVAGNETISCFPEVQSVSGRREPVNWEEYNRLRVQLGVEPVNRIPITTRSFSSDTMRARNSNILQAVLCLVKDLDRDSLDIVAAVVKARLDTI
ncbi:unnamed protein product [Candidula unifasciata]|uniref:U2A'/phosphoprotein 32 family A C-terminal domain-containing protein n=1 Tax=Candidula unifasciata TaxID=100452 RepID=A0A8S3ZGW2_9EUPU|nr:unnamed protein product [Candidula unifasciata]